LRRFLARGQFPQRLLISIRHELVGLSVYSSWFLYALINGHFIFSLIFI